MNFMCHSFTKISNSLLHLILILQRCFGDVSVVAVYYNMHSFVICVVCFTSVSVT